MGIMVVFPKDIAVRATWIKILHGAHSFQHILHIIIITNKWAVVGDLMEGSITCTRQKPALESSLDSSKNLRKHGYKGGDG